MNRLAALSVSAVVFVMSGCASGPGFKSVSASFPPVPAGSARIFFYRNANMGMGGAVQPGVNLNGEKIGNAVPGGFFYVDRPPGDYQVTTTTELKKSLTFHVDAGQVRYVRLGLSMGLMVGHINPELVEAQQAQPEIEKTKSPKKS